MEHEIDHRPVDHALLRGSQQFVILAQATVPIQPSERPLDDPSLGQDDLGATTGFNGWVAEVIMFNGKLSTADRTIVKSYIAAKYGLTIA